MKLWTKPYLGQTRKVKRFAWFPTYIGNDLIWLESYETREQYLEKTYVDVKYKYWYVYRKDRIIK